MGLLSAVGRIGIKIMFHYLFYSSFLVLLMAQKTKPFLISLLSLGFCYMSSSLLQFLFLKQEKNNQS